MKKSIVKFQQKLGTTYTGGLGCFIAVGKKKFRGKNVLGQAAIATTCREYLVALVRENSRGTILKLSVYSGGMEVEPFKAKIATDKARILYVTRTINSKTRKSTIESLFKRAETAVKMIRHLERLARWKGRTEVSSVVWKEGRQTVQCFLFTGPIKWVENPQLLSIYALLIRAGRFEGIGTFKSHSKFLKNVKSLKKSSTGDSVQLNEIAPYLKPFMQNLNRIYPKWEPNEMFERGGRGMLDFLRSKSTSNSKLAKARERLEKIMREIEKKNEKSKSVVKKKVRRRA